MIDDDVVVVVAKLVGGKKKKRKRITTIDEAKPTSASQVVVVTPSPTPFSTTPSHSATKETMPPSTSHILCSQQVPLFAITGNNNV